MKKILFLLALIPGIARADTCATSLMPLFTGAQAAEICSAFSAGTIGTLANNTYAVARNAADDANINVWKVDATDDTVLNADSGDVIKLSVAATPEVQISDDAVAFTGNTGLITAPTAIAFSAGAATTPVAQLDSTSGLAFSSNSSLQFRLVPLIVTPATNLTPAAANGAAPLTIVATAAPTNAAIALPESPVTGDTREILNLGANPVVVAALGTPSMNLAVTPGPRRVIMATRTSLRCTYSGSEASWLCFTGAGAFPTPAS